MLKKEEPLIQKRQSDGLLEKGSEIDGRYIFCGGMDWSNCDCILCTYLIGPYVT
jgi:hypothetical protein